MKRCGTNCAGPNVGSEFPLPNRRHAIKEKCSIPLPIRRFSLVFRGSPAANASPAAAARSPTAPAASPPASAASPAPAAAPPTVSAASPAAASNRISVAAASPTAPADRIFVAERSPEHAINSPPYIGRGQPLRDCAYRTGTDFVFVANVESPMSVYRTRTKPFRPGSFSMGFTSASHWLQCVAKGFTSGRHCPAR